MNLQIMRRNTIYTDFWVANDLLMTEDCLDLGTCIVDCVDKTET